MDLVHVGKKVGTVASPMIKGTRGTEYANKEDASFAPPMESPFDTPHASNELDETKANLKIRKKNKQEKRRKSLEIKSEGVAKKWNLKSGKRPPLKEDSDAELAEARESWPVN